MFSKKIPGSYFTWNISRPLRFFMVRSNPVSSLSSFSSKTYGRRIPSVAWTILLSLSDFLTGEGPGELTGVLIKMTFGCMSSVLSIGAK